jgi:hypothetical protein
MSSNTPISYERFKTNMLTLFDIVYEMFEDAQEHNIVSTKLGILKILKVCIKSCSGEKMIKNFIKRSHPFWDKIRNKDIEYFKNMGLDLFNDFEQKGLDSVKGNEEFQDNSGFMKNLSGEHINSFKKILESSYNYEGETYDIFDDERKNDVWQIMHSFVKISLLYIHEGRKKVDGKYTVEFFPEIKVKQNALDWGVKTI